MTAFVYRMPSGVPGALSRTGLALAVEQAILLSGSAPSAYGLPVAVDGATGHVRAIQAGDAAASVYGFLVRPFPTQGGDGQTTGLGVSAPPTSGQVDVLKLGYMSVKVTNGTPAKNGPVYVRVTANGSLPNTAVGDVEASADTGVTSAAGANTGNGTIGSLSATASALAGAYKITMLTATTFSVVDPNNNRLADGATGVAYSAEGVGFTVTAGGTAFAAGDSFTVTVAQNTVAVPRAYFTGAADSSGNAEIAFNV